MKSMISLSKNRIAILFILVLVLILAGCKVDLKDEIWLNSDASGKAQIEAYIEYASDVKDYNADTFLTENMLGDYIDLIDKTKGAKLISQNIIDKSKDDLMAATYRVEFSFDKIGTLNQILAVENTSAVTYHKDKHYGEVTLHPDKMSLVDMEGMKLDLSKESPFDISYHLVLHTPAKIKSTNAKVESRLNDKSVQWDFVIDDAWYKDPLKSIIVKF
jgi:hypothetical protein